MPRSLVDALNLYNDKRDRNNRRDNYGTVISVNGELAQVRLTGSGQAQTAQIPTGLDVQPQDRCLLEPLRQGNPRVRWVISNVVSQRDTGSRTGQQSPYPELFPPQNFVAEDTIEGVVVARWDAPVTMVVTFEINVSEDEETIDDVLFTRGSYAILKKEYTPVYLRIRSIAVDGQTSAWSDWLSVTPTTSSDEDLIPVTVCGNPVFAGGYQVMIPNDE